MAYSEWKNAGSEAINLGNGTSFNVSSYAGYKNFTTANFIVEAVSIYGYSSTNGNDNQHSANPSVGYSSNLSKSYNPSNGIFNVGGTTADGIEGSWVTTSGRAQVNVAVWLIS